MSTTVKFDTETPDLVRVDSLKPGDTFFFPATGIYYLKLGHEHVFRLTGCQSYNAFQRTTMSESTMVIPAECEIKLKRVM